MKDLSVRAHDTQPNRNYTISPGELATRKWEVVLASALSCSVSVRTILAAELKAHKPSISSR